MDTRQLNDVLKQAIQETNNLEQKDLVRFGKKWYAPVKFVTIYLENILAWMLGTHLLTKLCSHIHTKF